MGDYPIFPVKSKIAAARRRQLFLHYVLQFPKGVARLFAVPHSELGHREHRGTFGLSIRKWIFQNLQNPYYGVLEFSLAIFRQRFRASVKDVGSLAFAAS